MQIIKRKPGVAYLDNWLWLPRNHVSEAQIMSRLTYEGRNNDAIWAWEEEPHHFRVPRNFFSTEALGGLPFPVVDARFTAFPTVALKSRVTLDSKEPSKTYQRDGSAALLSNYDGILCLRCGAGKTVVALHTAAQVRQPILVVVGDKGLAKQWIEEIKQFLGVPEDQIGRVGGDGSPFDWKHDITVALVQTLANRASKGTLPPEMTRHFGVILCDEAHIMGAPYFNTGVPPFHGRRWGLSATPHREDEFDSLLRYTMGNLVYSYLMPDLMPEVWFMRLGTKLDLGDRKVREGVLDKGRKFHLGKAYGYFARELPSRTDTIASTIQKALDADRQVLVLTHSRDMCEELGKRFPQAGVCHGGVGEEDRLQRIRGCNPVIAIMQLGKQALNKPSLDTLFVCEPFTKTGMLQQTMGRVLRSFAGKKTPLVVFFEDRHVRELAGLCAKVRTKLTRWPAHKGGTIPYKIL